MKRVPDNKFSFLGTEERIRKLINSLRVGVLLQGPETEILFSNNAALSIATFDSVQVVISTPPPFPSSLNIARLPDGTVQLTIFGQTGATFRSEASSDLFVWAPIATNVNTSGTVQVLDSTARSRPRRFYRVVSAP